MTKITEQFDKQTHAEPHRSSGTSPTRIHPTILLLTPVALIAGWLFADFVTIR